MTSAALQKNEAASERSIGSRSTMRAADVGRASGVKLRGGGPTRRESMSTPATANDAASEAISASGWTTARRIAPIAGAASTLDSKSPL